MGKRAIVIVVLAACGNTPSETGDGGVDGVPPQHGTAKLEVTPKPIAFAATARGATAKMVATVANAGDGTSGSIFAHFETGDADEFFVEANRCAALDAAGSCAITIDFIPQRLGAAMTQLVVSDGSRTVKTPVTASGISAAALELDMESCTFPASVIGGSSGTISQCVFTITNVGELPSGTLASTYRADANTAEDEFPVDDKCDGKTLDPTKSCTVSYTFAPQAPHGTKTAGFTVSAMPGGDVTATVDGQAQNPAQLVYTPPSFDFGFVPPNSATAGKFVLSNTGDVSTTVITTGFSQPTSFFSITSDACATHALAAGQSCDVFVRYTVASGSDAAKTSTLFANATIGGTASSTLTGETTPTVNPTLTISPAGAFGPVAVGQTSTMTFTVKNAGGAATGVLNTTINSIQPAIAFTISNDNCVGTSLAMGGMCTLDVTYANPGTGNPSNAKLVVYSITPSVWGALPLSGM